MAETPNGWRLVQVQDFANVIRGASPRPKGDPRYYGGNIPRLMGADVTRDGKYVTPRIDFLTEAGAKLSRPMPAGTLTIVCSGLVGVPSILAVDACIHDGFLALENISKNDCDIEFLYYIFWQIRQDLESSATHGGIFTNLTTSILKEFEVPLPPLPEQHKIAAILSTWDDAIRLTGQLIAALKQRKQALMQLLLTGQVKNWKHVRLGTLTTKIGSGITPTGGSKVYRAQGIPFIRSQNVLAGRLDLSDVVYISSEQHQEMSNSKLQPLDVLLNITGASIGRCCVLPETFDEGNVNQHVCIIRPNDQLLSHFLAAYLNSDKGQKQIDQYQAGGNRQGLNYQQIAAFTIPHPPLEEQTKIADVFLTCDELTAMMETQISLLQTQKRGLMQQLLTGAIRVQVDE